jgi:class 3 adenylate cyclase
MDGVQRPQRRPITVLFADLRNFSALGERLEPEELIKLVNSFFAEAVGAISRHQGLIDKFMGDAVMALFNTPLNPQTGHAEQAMRAALAIKDNVIQLRRAMPADKTLHFGIGINCGEAVVGNVGSDLRKDYSAIGDVVNLAKRLQEVARYDEIIISEEMYRQVQTTADVEPLSPMQIKGRQSPVQVYNLMGLRNDH